MVPPLTQYDREALATLQQIHLPELLDNFSLARDCAGDAATGAVASRTGTSASSEKEELLIWSTDIFRARPFEADLANLLPASTDRASVQCVLRMSAIPRRLRARMKMLQKAIQGTLGDQENRRIEFTGVQHLLRQDVVCGHCAKHVRGGNATMGWPRISCYCPGWIL
jgi:hypothetical protein